MLPVRLVRTVLLAGSAALLSACAPGTIPTPGGDEGFRTASSSYCTDLPGVYEGLIPAADCPGIRVTLFLRASGTYTMTESYVDRDFTAASGGNWSLSEKGRLVLEPLQDRSPVRLFAVEPAAVRYLTLDGEPIEGELADHYLLRKPGCRVP